MSRIFAFTTILGWDYYSERCLEYLSGKNKKAVLIYRWLYILAVFIGTYMTVKAVWTIADIFKSSFQRRKKGFSEKESVF